MGMHRLLRSFEMMPSFWALVLGGTPSAAVAGAVAGCTPPSGTCVASTAMCFYTGLLSHYSGGPGHVTSPCVVCSQTYGKSITTLHAFSFSFTKLTFSSHSRS